MPKPPSACLWQMQKPACARWDAPFAVSPQQQKSSSVNGLSKPASTISVTRGWKCKSKTVTEQRWQITLTLTLPWKASWKPFFWYGGWFSVCLWYCKRHLGKKFRSCSEITILLHKDSKLSVERVFVSCSPVQSVLLKAEKFPCPIDFRTMWAVLVIIFQMSVIFSCFTMGLHLLYILGNELVES